MLKLILFISICLFINSNIEANNFNFLNNVQIHEINIRYSSEFTYTSFGNKIFYISKFDTDSVIIKSIDLDNKLTDQFLLYFPSNSIDSKTTSLECIALNNNNDSKIALLFNNVLICYENKVPIGVYKIDKMYNTVKYNNDTLLLIRNFKLCENKENCNNSEFKFLKLHNGNFEEERVINYNLDFIEYTSEYPNSWLTASDNLKFILKSNVLEYNIEIHNLSSDKKYTISPNYTSWDNSSELKEYIKKKDTYKILDKKKDSMLIDIHNLNSKVKSQMHICKFIDDSTLYVSYMLKNRFKYNPMYIDIYKYNSIFDEWIKTDSLTQQLPSLDSNFSNSNFPFALPHANISFFKNYITSISSYPSLNMAEKKETYRNILDEARQNYESKNHSIYINIFNNGFKK